MTPTDSHHYRGFSVASILLLTAAVAIFLAALRTVAVEPSAIPGDQLGLRAISGILIGTFVGLGMGLTRPRRRWGIPLGLLTGWFVGGAAGSLFADPRNLPLAVIGSLVLIVLGVVVRAGSSRPA